MINFDLNSTLADAEIAAAIGREPSIVELPDFAGALIAKAGFLPGAPITQDQWRMLQSDNIVTGVDGLKAMGIEATPMSTVAPGWLVRFRKAGRFGRRAETRVETGVDTHSATHVV